MALIRHPGSKAKLLRPIFRYFPEEMLFELRSNCAGWEYREPFFGAGAIGFGVLRWLSKACPVWFNDFDPGIVALWTSVRDHSDELVGRVLSFRPSPEEGAEIFYRFKEEDGRWDGPIAEIGFRKLVLHQLSYSGLGYKAGGPIGGRRQENAGFPSTCRWKPENLAKDITCFGNKLRAFRNFQFTNLDFENCIRDAPRECFIYLDPPYVKKGPELYKYPMDEADHKRLRDALMDCRASWVLSYDDHEMIRNLYGAWTRIEPIRVTYTTATARTWRRPKNREIVISPN